MFRIRMLTLACWCLFEFWAFVFYLFWRTGHSWPHAAWSVLSLGSVIAVAVALAVFCTRTFVWHCHSNSRQRIAILGWVLIGYAPLACFGAHWLDAAMTFGQRLPQPKTATSEVAVTWLSSFFDFVSRSDRRREIGRHVVLVHSTDVDDPARLVSEMDVRIREMCDLLGRQPTKKIAWVRGSLLSQTGMSISVWAITDDGQPANELSSLDRHEVAHSVISQLCGPDHQPPHLLVEGWAQFQGNDWSGDITGLSNEFRKRARFHLDELIQEPWYSASRWPVYRYGGPFVAFLILEFSPEQFFDLYDQVRKETFRADAERILGKSWKDVEKSFWSWIVVEAERISNEEATDGGRRSVVEFSADVRPEDWDELASHYDVSQWDVSNDESCVQFEVTVEVEESALESPKTRHFQLVVEPNQRWIRYRSVWDDVIGVATGASMATGSSMAISVERSNKGQITGTAFDIEGRPQARGDMHNCLRAARQTYSSDPAMKLPIGKRWPEQIDRFRCESIRRPVSESGVVASSRIWKLNYRDWYSFGSDSPIVERTGEIWLDELLGMAVTRHRYEDIESTNRCETDITYQQLDGLTLPKTVEETRVEGTETYHTLSTCGPMSDSEAASMKQDILSMANEVKASPGMPWFRIVLLCAYSMPILGFCFVLVGIDRKP